MEPSGSLDFLVKLASFGTAGVCILAIFFIGSAIIKLPNDSPSWKPQLMKRFISACIIIAGITAVSGGLNAYFNRGKIVEADRKTETSLGETQVVANEYENLRIQYADLSMKVTSLIEQLERARNSESPPVNEAQTNMIMEEIKASEPKPLDLILDSRSLYMIESKQKPVNPDRLKINR
jgi:hypothetical protein